MVVKVVFVLINTNNMKCKHCKTKFIPKRFLMKYCCETEECAKAFNEFAKAKMQKNWNKEKKVIKENLMTKGDWIKICQTHFNTYIRLRDAHLPCISCGVYNCEEFHAGHYIATTYQFLRFNELNVHKQCSKCNTHLRGNSIPYRINLIKKIGLKAVEKLENERHLNFELDINGIKELTELYKQKIKDLK